MVDFFPLIERAISALEEPTSENRAAVYKLIRTELNRQLPLSDGVNEREALESAILRLEAIFAHDNTQECGVTGDSSLPTSALTTPSRRQFVLNAASSGVVSVIKTTVQILMLPLMARLLGPTPYSIYAIAFPTVLFFIMLADGGLSASMSREDERNQIFWSTASWVLLITCTVMAACVCLSGFVLAWISGERSLVGIMAVLSLALPLVAILVPADARLVRRGNLMYHSAADLSSTLIGAVTAVLLAVKGAGAWSLVFQYIVTFAVRATVLNCAARSVPSMVFDLRSLRGHLAIGGAGLLSRLCEMMCRAAENSFFGSIFGTMLLGSYTFSNQVSRFACDAVTNPLVGAFYAHALHASDDDVIRLNTRLNRIIMFTLFPMSSICIVLAPVAFPVVLGPKWLSAVPMFQVIILPYAFLSISYLSGQIMMKHGIVKRSSVISIISSVMRVVLVSIGYFLPPVLVTALIGCLSITQAICTIYAVPPTLRVGMRSLFSDMTLPIFSSLLTACVSMTFLNVFSHDVVGLILVGCMSMVSFALTVFVIGGRRIREEIIGLGKALRHRLPSFQRPAQNDTAC